MNSEHATGDPMALFAAVQRNSSLLISYNLKTMFTILRHSFPFGCIVVGTGGVAGRQTAS